MARTIFDSAHRDELLDRLDRLRPDAKAQWGKMTPPRMICHLADSLRVAGGEVPSKFKPGPLANPIVRWLLAYVIPFRKERAQNSA